MPQNRKRQAMSVRFGPLLMTLLLCLLIGGAGVGYVWQKSQISGLGRELKRRETRLEELEDHNEKLLRHLATMRSPRYLDRRARELNLGLAPAQPMQILRLPEPQGWPAGEPTTTQFADHAHRTAP